jgi:hypothetical protein
MMPLGPLKVIQISINSLASIVMDGKTALDFHMSQADYRVNSV